MDVYLGDIKIFSLPEEIFPAFYYFSLELGFQVEWNRTDERVTLLPGLSHTNIVLSKDQSLQSSLRREEFEDQLLQYIERSLLSCGVHLNKSELNHSETADLNLLVTTNQIQFLNQPILEIYYYKEDIEAEWINYIKSECTKLNIKYNIHVLDGSKKNQTVKVHVMYPEAMEDSFWESIGENLAFILSVGLISKLQKSHRLTPFSILPFEELLKGFIKSDYQPLREFTNKTNQLEEEIETINSKSSNEEENETEQLEPIDTSTGESTSQYTAMKQVNHNAEAFFDYHLLINQTDSKSPKIFGNLTIKNTGSEPLKNPIICFRITPPGSVTILGQILQPNTIQTQGVQTALGPKGWRYMNENWLQEAEEKGEIWVCSIHELHADPGQDFELSNLQMTVKNLDVDKNIKVEAFIFFAEHGLEIQANNKISVLLNRS